MRWEENMESVLILSKNPYCEQKLQELLQRSNYEVYCSSSMLAQLETIFVKHFSIIIVSETVSTREFVDILPQLLAYNIPIIRRGSSEVIQDTEYSWIENKIAIWMDINYTDANIIDGLGLCTIGNRVEEIDLEDENVSRKLTLTSYIDFLRVLTTKERILLFNLMEADGDTVSRKYLCHKLWSESSSKSNLSQLSALIYRLKAKISKVGIYDTELRTVWGKGYQMGKTLCNFLKLNGFTDK